MKSMQDRKWVEKHLKNNDLTALVDHLIQYHADGDGDKCVCQMNAQEIVDHLNWDRITGEEDYYYRTGPREYTRFMLRRPELNHSKYTLCVLRTRDMEKCLLHFSAHHGKLPRHIIRKELDKRAAHYMDSVDIEPARISAHAISMAMNKKDENTAAQVKEFLEAYQAAFSILEVHES
jgi:hypothetical protein